MSDTVVALRPHSAPKLPAPEDFPESPYAQALRQPMLLGLFVPIQAGGWSASTLPRSTTWTFDYNSALVKRADELGFDLAFGLSQWLPKGGYGEVMNGMAIDSFISLAAMTAMTSRIILVATTHVLYGPWHPLHFAKYGATLDHISKGRWGFNVVTGHRAVEHEMFGWPRIEHDKRYDMAAEFLDAVQHLWHEEDNFSFEPRISPWRMKGAFVTPKPLYGRPLLINATGSDAGIRFAAKYSDLVFITSPTTSEIEGALEALPAHAGRVKAEGHAQGRTVRTIINPMIVCRETEKEAWEYHDAIAAHADPTAHFLDSDAHAWRGRGDRKGESRAVGGNIRIVGSPEQVVDYILRLRKAGVDGVQLSFFDFQPDLEFFGSRVLPLLKQAGLRN
ncbi:MAG TPA: LLM class flavin-dependent oxidoreductase [Rhizomicrobium sp.]|nr:LLM class flavin-dependent oxidoreductase [Rhizomicrobium sp.]